MKHAAPSRVPFCPLLFGEVWDDTTVVAERSTTGDGARSARIIRLWRSYLPENCVNTMLKMGWDRTT
jgi:hypothetical protein